MELIDITRPLGPQTPVYPGDPAVTVERLSAAAGGDSYALSRITLGSHAGTHVDPPAHFIPGAATVDQIDLESCIGPAVVLHMPGGGPLLPEHLDSLPDGTARVLIRTDSAPVGGRALTPATARRLVERGVRLVGIDTLSVAPADAPGEVHRILLATGVVILEGLDLSAAVPGHYTLICLPLKLAGGDGAPARAVLVTGRALTP